MSVSLSVSVCMSVAVAVLLFVGGSLCLSLMIREFFLVLRGLSKGLYIKSL